MPELPEVETIKLVLQRRIVGKTIKDIQVLSSKSFIGQPQDIKDKKILKIWRRAKLLGIDLSSDKTLLFHLKMTGQLIHEDGKRPALPDASRGRFIGGHPTEDMKGPMPNSHTRVIFTFSSGSKLYFNDQRRFGWIKVSDKGKMVSDKSLINLGPEPLEKNFTWEVLKINLLKHKSMPIKAAIMDQSVISGVGNIYASEACFAAKIDPRRKVSNLSDKKFRSLFWGIRKALKKGIKYGGSTRAHFVDPEGHKGYFLDYAFVYGRDKHSCKVCQSEIKKISLGGRGTYYCPKCQK
ncbi:bifunctional DNA-formamidopyrimidine glycosylase/DNA-(apurinic or apyrimidinic site) lyase [Candidatus Daviesbacteria bacterium]|nr:bifunctional DNA-formamidopyrimidine glycosylase/DNA-(apurinic or apyrimidinic site) lyase [Candidatus Daviesbacteria bacterium]